MEWYATGEEEPTDAEMLFFAFVLCMNATSVSELQA